MLNLDDAIKHCEEVAEEQEKLCKVNDSFNFAQPKWKECGEEHRQLAEWLKEYKRLKEQDPCEKAVSVQDCINAIENTDCELSPQAWKEITTSIMSLPPVTPAQRWIHVSERLPEENGFYLATCDGEICGENEPFTGLAEYENGKWVDDEEDYQCVLAWMPLPKPYQEEKGEE